MACPPEQSHRDLASASVRVRRAVLWLARHPHVSVLGLLGVVAVLTLATVSAVGPLFTGAAPVHGERDTSAIVPVPTQRPPRHRVDAVHEALHAVGKLCKPAEVNRGRRPLTRAIETIRGFAAQYPRGGVLHRWRARHHARACDRRTAPARNVRPDPCADHRRTGSGPVSGEVAAPDYEPGLNIGILMMNVAPRPGPSLAAVR